jgi:aldose 1-epimerase
MDKQLNLLARFTLQSGKSYFGALVGRVANRIANARFVLDGKAYHLFKNDGNNTLHGIYT